MKHYLRKKLPEKRIPIVTKSINLLPNYTCTKNDVIIIIPLFNISKSVRIYQNFLYIIQLFERSNIPHYIIELSYFNEPFFTTPQENYYHLNTDSIMFHKENLLKIAINNLSSKYNKFCIMDGDIIFDDLDFYDNMSILLNTYDIIQPFKTAEWLSINMTTIIKSAPSACYMSSENLTDYSHPGFVWAFTLETYKKIENFIDIIPIGSNDSLLSCKICDVANHKKVAKESLLKTNITIDLEPLDLKYFYLDCTIYHLFHGTLVKRKYLERYNDFKKLIQENTDYRKINEEGLCVWTEEYKEILNTYMLGYFKSREDDNI